MEKEWPVYSRRQIEDLIANGRNIIIVDGKVLKCDAWMPYHPGGDKAIRHMVGRDATDEVNAYDTQSTLRRIGLTNCDKQLAFSRGSEADGFLSDCKDQ